MFAYFVNWEHRLFFFKYYEQNSIDAVLVVTLCGLCLCACVWWYVCVCVWCGYILVNLEAFGSFRNSFVMKPSKTLKSLKISVWTYFVMFLWKSYILTTCYIAYLRLITMIYMLYSFLSLYIYVYIYLFWKRIKDMHHIPIRNTHQYESSSKWVNQSQPLRYNTLQWRHNERDGVYNHQRLDCLLSHLFRRR